MKASVIIPNLNGAGWLRDSIESVWAQTEQDFELIITILIVVPNKIVTCGVKCVRNVRKHIRSGQPVTCHVPAECCLCNTADFAEFFL